MKGWLFTYAILYQYNFVSNRHGARGAEPLRLPLRALGRRRSETGLVAGVLREGINVDDPPRTNRCKSLHADFQVSLR